jgi:hypothetical protein
VFPHALCGWKGYLNIVLIDLTFQESEYSIDTGFSPDLSCVSCIWIAFHPQFQRR